MVENLLSVSMLGGFTMRHQAGGIEYVLTEQDSTSKRLWIFLQYLAAFSGRPVNQSELIEVIWGDDEASADPANALKTLLHRARNAMEQLGFPDGKKIIQYRRGLYNWDPEIEIELDTQHFDLLCNQAQEGDIEAAIEAIDLYEGDFLPNAAGSPWAVSMRTYYHTQFLKACDSAALALCEGGRYEQAVQICRRATILDPYNENSHLLLMRALSALGSQQAAIQHYSHVADMFMNQLGVSPSEEMMQFYRELTKMEMNVEMDIHVVRDKLEEKNKISGAYFCEYFTFQNIYQLEARSVQRSGRVVQLAMLTLTDRRGNAMESKQRAVAMEELHEAIRGCLRSGDAFTRVSATQYLILLPTANYENGVKVLQRIIDRYENTLAGKGALVQYSLLPVLPAEEKEYGTAHFAPME